MKLRSNRAPTAARIIVQKGSGRVPSAAERVVVRRLRTMVLS